MLYGHVYKLNISTHKFYILFSMDSNALYSRQKICTYSKRTKYTYTAKDDLNGALFDSAQGLQSKAGIVLMEFLLASIMFSKHDR